MPPSASSTRQARAARGRRRFGAARVAGQPVGVCPARRGRAAVRLQRCAPQPVSRRAGPRCRSPSRVPRTARPAARPGRSPAARSGRRCGPRTSRWRRSGSFSPRPRASWRGRPARRAADFYAATRTLGVARGIGEFTRYGRAAPQRPGIRRGPARPGRRRENAPRCGWPPKSRTGRTGSAGATPRRPSARRRAGFEKAHLEYARDGGPRRSPGHARRAHQAWSRPSAAAAGPGTRRRYATPRPRGRFLPSSPARRVARSCGSLPGSPPAPPCPAPDQAQLSAAHHAAAAAPGRPAVRRRAQPNGRWRDAPLVPGFGVAAVAARCLPTC